MKITYYDPETFLPTEHEFDDFHYKLTETVRNIVSLDEKPLDGIVSTIICNNEGKKLMFGFIKNRHNGEEIAEKYKITIEKITDSK